MQTSVPSAPQAPTSPPDEPLRCPTCEYNLTGITSAQCPECGTVIDWNALRAERERERTRPGTCWERWPWYLKPAGFAVTALHVAVTPWIFAAQLPSRPRLRWPLAFALLCVGSVGLTVFRDGDGDLFYMWVIASISCIGGQVILFRLILRPRHVKHPWRYWLAVSCYTSYPLPIQALAALPAYILFFETPVWPFSEWSDWTDIDIVTSILFWLWWADILVIALIRSRRKDVWRVALLAVMLLALAVGVSYLGFYAGVSVGGFPW